MTAWAGGTAERRQGASREGESHNRTAMTANPLFLLLSGLHILFVWNILSPTSMCPFEVLLQCSSINEASSIHPVSHSHDTPALNRLQGNGCHKKGLSFIPFPD